ncbi:hypothetical protein CRG98_029088 [Punica granatum]|uniref:Uncharacterized protein n=1 Tax=Punica granatum TaxID=22663 RepID=A0A2I0J2S9_PUNGR|nr:hypothetical protein CRG98_029088 [Punica granatum]
MISWALGVTGNEWCGARILGIGWCRFRALATSAAIYTVLRPMAFSALQSHIGLPYQALLPINIPFPEPGTPTHAAPVALPTNFLHEEETEQERRFKKMEEMIKALQAGAPP